jgi:hypothetical protein
MKTVKVGSEERDAVYGRGLLQAPGDCSTGKASVSKLAPAAGSLSR